MNRKLFNRYFSDIAMYTVPIHEQPEEEAAPQEEDSQDQEQQPEEEGAPDEDAPPEEDPNVDPEAMPEDPNAAPGEEAGQVEISIGRIYELKKIYAKLLAIDKLLDNHSDVAFDETKQKIMEALDLFHIISLNLDKFNDKLDSIIIDFYKFLKDIVEEIAQLGKSINRKTKENENESSKNKKKSSK